MKQHLTSKTQKPQLAKKSKVVKKAAKKRAELRAINKEQAENKKAEGAALQKLAASNNVRILPWNKRWIVSQRRRAIEPSKHILQSILRKTLIGSPFLGCCSIVSRKVSTNIGR